MSIQNFLSNANKLKAKKSEVKETDIESEYVKYAKSLGCTALKLIILHRKGFPDRTTLCPGGRILFIEFKRKGKKPSPAQKIVRRILISLEFEYHVCDKKGQAEAILNKFLKNE